MNIEISENKHDNKPKIDNNYITDIIYIINWYINDAYEDIEELIFNDDKFSEEQLDEIQMMNNDQLYDFLSKPEHKSYRTHVWYKMHKLSKSIKNDIKRI